MEDAADAPTGGRVLSGRPSGRRRLARTLSGARWREYRSVLERAVECGYAIVPVEEWILKGPRDERPVLILRHDVDQHPRCVRPMLRAERKLGLSSTWYFRWRTADRRIIAEVSEAGHGVGLHFETLTREALRRGEAQMPSRTVIDAQRDVLRAELRAFDRLFRPAISACPHGDSRAPGLTNQVLTRQRDPHEFGLACDGNDGLNARDLSIWLTDRSAPDGSWKDGMDPMALLADRRSPMLLLTHPNNFASGASLWLDRLLAAALPTPKPGKRSVVIRTGSDDPPQLTGSHPAAGGRFRPIAAELEQEVRRHYDERGERLEGPSGQNTLLTNSHFAERRARTLLAALQRGGGPHTVAGLRVADVGCGFGALSVFLASEGAEVVAVDPNRERFAVGEAVARRHGLDVQFARRWMEELELPNAHFDLMVVNNSFCYVVDPRARAEALHRMREALRPGGWLLMRNPNRLHPRDQFTGLPFVSMLPPRAARAVTGVLRRHRSAVRLATGRAMRRELRGAGFSDVTVVSPRAGWRDRLLTPVARYQHAVARKPEVGADA